ncbi:MAG TPA: hypothetical protein VFP61_15570 [Acidimicrobiales bacterium]|nr:hypothetical protein [Acidimicrobiales bacterium]
MAALASALERLAIDVVVDDGSSDHISIVMDGRRLTFTIRAVAYCTASVADGLVKMGSRSRATVLVADQVTADARSRLTEAGWSWLDRRGRLHLHAPGVWVDVEIPAIERPGPGRPLAPIAGRGGLAVAYWLCAHPDEHISPNRHAAELGIAPSTISTAVSRLRGAGLVDGSARGVVPELFWELADAWPVERTWLIEPPRVEGHTPADPLQPRWKRSGTAAAAAYGAPVVTRSSGTLELYATGPVEVSIAARQYGEAQPGGGAASVAVAPVAAVTTVPGDPAPLVDGWPAAPLLTVALDLAQDRSRGREILTEWKIADAPWR